MNRQQERLSLLIQVADAPGALAETLKFFSDHHINLTHIESRPARGGYFDFYVDCEGTQGDAPIDAVIKLLQQRTHKLLILDHKQVPWFPRQIEELDLIAGRTLDAGTDLTADHPGFHDTHYRQRRAHIDALARSYRHGDPVPLVEYTEDEHQTWETVYRALESAHQQHGCAEYLSNKRLLERHCQFGPKAIPQGRELSAFLESRTGFSLRPVPGLLSSRDFLNGLAFRVFFCTQYIRHASVPLYTPEPDVCHELLGHVPMFADPSFADLSQEIGLASLGASDDEITQLARCYWHAVEFGLLRENQQLKAYGAGLLSSSGELSYACSGDTPPEYQPWQPQLAAAQDFPITEYQPVYFVADDLHHAKSSMRAFCQQLARPFYARYHSSTGRIWVDRAVRRQQV